MMELAQTVFIQIKLDKLRIRVVSLVRLEVTWTLPSLVLLPFLSVICVQLGHLELTPTCVLLVLSPHPLKFVEWVLSNLHLFLQYQIISEDQQKNLIAFFFLRFKSLKLTQSNPL